MSAAAAPRTTAVSSSRWFMEPSWCRWLVATQPAFARCLAPRNRPSGRDTPAQPGLKGGPDRALASARQTPSTETRHPATSDPELQAQKRRLTPWPAPHQGHCTPRIGGSRCVVAAKLPRSRVAALEQVERLSDGERGFSFGTTDGDRFSSRQSQPILLLLDLLPKLS